MSAQIIEVLIFAAIAFFVISKLIAILGTTDEDRQVGKSRFGERSGIKDVTPAGGDWESSFGIQTAIKKKPNIDQKLLADPTDKNIISQLEEVSARIEKFTPETFVKNASKAWKLIIESVRNSDNEMIVELVDKRYVESVNERSELYDKVDLKTMPEVKISDVTFFGNSVMIRCLFKVKGIELEEWTFSKNQNQPTPNWFLSNIERAT
jgi:predicted lipid-binding transport protein (Tim44 family)